MGHTKTLLKFYGQGVHIVRVGADHRVQGTYDYMPRSVNDPCPWVATDPNNEDRPHPRGLLVAYEGTGAFMAFSGRCPVYRCRQLVDILPGAGCRMNHTGRECPHCGTTIHRFFAVQPGRSVWTPWLTGQQAVRVNVWLNTKRKRS